MKASMQEIRDRILRYPKELRLPAVRQEFEEQARQVGAQKSSYEQYLLDLLEREHLTRSERRKKQHVRRARFPYRKYLEDLEVAELPPDAAEKLSVLKRLDFIGQGRNIVLAGNPGTGKTHLAIALCTKVCREDYQVLFTTVPHLLTQIKESRSQKMLRMLESRFEKYNLVFCDEYGYISFDKEASELLFTHLSLRAGRKSTIITTNLSFDRWQEIFDDPVITAAMVDRLTQKAYITNMNGNSYRVKETKKQMDKQAKPSKEGKV